MRSSTSRSTRMWSVQQAVRWPDRREAGHLLQIGQVHVVADVAARGVVGRGEVPRRLHAGAERLAHGDPPLLALREPRGPASRGPSARRPPAGTPPPAPADAGSSTRLTRSCGSAARSKSWSGSAGEWMNLCRPAPDHHDRRDRALGEVLRHRPHRGRGCPTGAAAGSGRRAGRRCPTRRRRGPGRPGSAAGPSSTPRSTPGRARTAQGARTIERHPRGSPRRSSSCTRRRARRASRRGRW